VRGYQTTPAELCQDLPRTGPLGFFRDLTARGLAGVKLVTSDAHRGLVD
jgi:transposase-like protein